MRFRPSWDHLEPLRQYAEIAIKTRADEPSAEKASIVVQELLENAVKYSEPSSEIELEVSIATDSSRFVVVVRNTAAPSRLTALQREFKRVSGDTAHASFTRALQRLQKMPVESSMLGLSRVAMEATLQLQVEADRVTITAHVDLPASLAKR